MSGELSLPNVNSCNVTKKLKLSNFHRLRLRVCLSINDCAELCGVTVRSVQRWDIEGAPLIAHRLLEMYDRKDVRGQGEDWRGFRFSRGKLVSGTLSFTPRNLRQIPSYVELVNRVQMARTRHYLDGLPMEQCWPIVFGTDADWLPTLLGELNQESQPRPLLISA